MDRFLKLLRWVGLIAAIILTVWFLGGLMGTWKLKLAATPFMLGCALVVLVSHAVTMLDRGEDRGEQWRRRETFRRIVDLLTLSAFASSTEGMLRFDVLRTLKLVDPSEPRRQALVSSLFGGPLGSVAPPHDFGEWLWRLRERADLISSEQQLQLLKVLEYHIAEELGYDGPDRDD